MNPLRKNQITKLEKLGCSDLARKIQEIVDHINGDCNHEWHRISPGEFVCRKCGKSGEIKEKNNK